MKPRVLFNTVLTNDNVQVTDHIPPHDIDGALTYLTYDFWEFTGTQTLLVDGADTAPVDSFGIYGDGLVGVEVEIGYSTDSAEYTTIYTGTITQDGATLFVFDEAILSPYWQILFTVGSDSDCKVRNMLLGQSLEFERCLMGTFAPSPYNRQSKLISSGSGDAQFLSKRFIYEGFETQVNLNMMSKEWARYQFQLFVDHALRSAYFFSWNPVDYPSEAIYGWTDEDIGLAYTGDAALMSSSWTVKR